MTNAPPPGSTRAWLAQAQAGAAGLRGPARTAAAATLAELRCFSQAALDAPPVARVTEPKHAAVVLDVEAGVLDVLRRCAMLHLADKKAERNKGALAWLAAGFFVVAFVAFIAKAVPVVVAAIAIAIVILLARWWVDANDIEDRKLDVVSGVLARLGSEIDLDRPVKVHADFKAYDQTTSVDGQFQHGWLEMRFVLADGTRVEITATQCAKRKTRSKRKYNKIKDRSVERLVVRLAAPKDKTFATAQAPRNPGRVAAGLVLRGAQMQPRYAQFQFDTAPTTRVRARGGWTASGLENELDAPSVFAAVVSSYRLAASADRAA